MTPLPTQPDAARLAGKVLRCATQAEQVAKGGRFEDHWHHICNRAPRLVRIANRQEGRDKLTDLEPTAHAAYTLGTATHNLFYKRFNGAMLDLARQFPDLGTEGRWEKLKELDPRLFDSFLLDFVRQPPLSPDAE